MPAPLVSVIVPTYNCAPFVAAALDSVLTQDYPAFEVVVADDGSTDDTLRILQGYGERIRIVTGPNGGPARARNRAVRAARGEYLAFLDGDDLWLPGKLSAQMAYLGKHPQTQVVYSHWLVWEAAADGSYRESDLPQPISAAPDEVDASLSGWVYPQLLLDSIIHIIAAVIHRSVYDHVDGFDESLRTGSDWDFWLRVARHFQAVKLRRTMAVYRLNPTSVTYTIRRENNGYRLLERALDRYGLGDDAGHRADGRAVSRRLSDLAFTHGYRHYWSGDAQVAFTSFAQAWKHDPLRLKAAAYMAAAMAKRLGLSRRERASR